MFNEENTLCRILKISLRSICDNAYEKWKIDVSRDEFLSGSAQSASYMAKRIPEARGAWNR